MHHQLQCYYLLVSYCRLMQHNWECGVWTYFCLQCKHKSLQSDIQMIELIDVTRPDSNTSVNAALSPKVSLINVNHTKTNFSKTTWLKQKDFRVLLQCFQVLSWTASQATFHSRNVKESEGSVGTPKASCRRCWFERQCESQEQLRQTWPLQNLA